MEFTQLKLEIQDEIATILLNNPDKLNPFSIRMGKEFIEALYECEYEESVRCIIVTGEGRAFCAGGDIGEMSDYPEARKGIFFKKLTAEFNNTVKSIRSIPKPVIAAVNGFASGAGFPLALACDLIVASESARFNVAHVQIGLHPDGGTTYFLPRLIGVHKTRELVFMGSVVDAAEARDLNIVNKVVPPDRLMEVTIAMAKSLAMGPSVAIGLAKISIDRGLSENLEGQLEIECQAVAQTAMTHDILEGIEAFLQKRKPVFKGK